MEGVFSCGVFIFNSDNELLICHPTGQPLQCNWSIPKGKMDLGENELETALRETYEESNVYLYDVKRHVKYMGTQKYKKRNKFIVGFIYKFVHHKNLDLKCTSLIEQGNQNVGKPENDILKFVNIKIALKLLHEAQKKLLLNYLNNV